MRTGLDANAKHGGLSNLFTEKSLSAIHKNAI